MSDILVIGHKNPDTDSICAAIGYAEFKRRTGMTNAVAARCGDSNERIDFVLKHFGTPLPRFVSDVSPRVSDVMVKDVVALPPNATMAEALALMDERNIRMLPVLNDDGTCRGLLSVFKMGKFFFPAPNRPFDSRKVHASANNLARTLQGHLITGVNIDSCEDLMLMIAAMSLESFSQRMSSVPLNRLVVIVGDRADVQRLAIENKVRAIIVTGNLSVSEEMVELAKAKGVCLISSPHDSLTTATLARSSITIERMMHDTFLSFRADELLSDVRVAASDTSYQAFPVLDDQGKVAGILSKSDLIKKVERQLILVDHNELSQAVNGADQVEILEVIDHHRISFTIQQPILFRNEPVGSTSTIVAEEFQRHHVHLPPKIAGLLLAGIISDTLNLTSPTTTSRDKKALEILEMISNTNARQFTDKLFASGSVLVSKPARQAVTADCKEYQEHGRNFSVAQIEELGFDQFWKRKTEVVEALNDHREANGYYFSALFVTDVVLQTSLLAIAGPDAFKDRIVYKEVEPGIYALPGVVSRKKQLLPYLTGILTHPQTERQPS